MRTYVGFTLSVIFTTLSQPLAVEYVCVYVPTIVAVPPHGKLYVEPWQIDAVLFVINVELIVSTIFTTLSQPLAVEYVCVYVPAIVAVPPHGKLYVDP